MQKYQNPMFLKILVHFRSALRRGWGSRSTPCTRKVGFYHILYDPMGNRVHVPSSQNISMLKWLIYLLAIWWIFWVCALVWIFYLEKEWSKFSAWMILSVSFLFMNLSVSCWFRIWFMAQLIVEECACTSSEYEKETLIMINLCVLVVY